MKNLKINLYNNPYIPYIKSYLISFFIISFIFLSGLKYEYFQFRFLILLLLIPSAFILYSHIKKKNYNFLIFLFLLSVILFIHIGLNLYYEKAHLTKNSLFGVFFFLSIFTVSYYYFDFINKNIEFLIKFFIIIFFSSCLYNIYEYKPDTPFFCGGIGKQNFIHLGLFEYLGPRLVEPRLEDLRLSFSEFIFPENSHLGMVAPGILIYSIYKITSQKVSTFYKFILFIFLIICFIKSSTTLFIGTIFSLILIVLFNYKVLNKKTLLSFFVLIIFISTIVLSSKECKKRFVPVYEVEKNYSPQAVPFDYYVLYDNEEDDPDGSIYDEDKREAAQLKSTEEIVEYDTAPLKTINKKNYPVIKGVNINLAYNIKKIFNTNGSMSSGVYFHAITIATRSIVEKPFGWGLNRYNQAFMYFNKIEPAEISQLNHLNSKDGTNNLIKIIVEFGIFGVCFYLFIVLFLINNKISLELKLFYVPFIITQSLRGSGYFNGGFILIIFLMLFTYINIYKKI